MAEQIEQRTRQSDDPGDRGEQRQAREQRQRQAHLPAPVLTLRRKPAGEDRDEHQVVDTEHDLEQRSASARLTQICGSRQPIHIEPLANCRPGLGVVSSTSAAHGGAHGVAASRPAALASTAARPSSARNSASESG